MKYRIEDDNDKFGWNVVHDELAVSTILDAYCEDKDFAQAIADALNAQEASKDAKYVKDEKNA